MGKVGETLKKVYILIFAIVLATCTAGLTLPHTSLDQDRNKGSFIQDVLGRIVEVPTVKPLRVVSLSPGNTEIIFAIGAGDRLVGVTTYCDYPEAAKRLPKAGGFLDPDVEKIILMEPNIVFTSGQMQRKTIQSLERAGITVVAVEPQNMNEVIKAVRLIGRLLHEPGQSEQVAVQLENRLKAVQAMGASHVRQKVFIEIWDIPMLTAGAKSYISDIVTQAGGINVAGDRQTDYSPCDYEALYTYNPDTYLVVRNGMAGKESRIVSKDEIADLSAIKNKQVYYVSDDYLARPGPRSFAALEQIAQILNAKSGGAQQ